MRILGVSFDSPEENAAFAEKFDFPFSLLCDTEREMGLAYGACRKRTDKYPERITYVIGPDGTIEQAIDTQDPAKQAKQILTSLEVAAG